MGSDITDHNLDIRESHNSEQLTHQDNKREVSNRSKSGTERDQDRIVGTKEGAEVGRRDESAQDLELAGSFAISRGLFSHWQVWVAVGAGIQACAMTLRRYGR